MPTPTLPFGPVTAKDLGELPHRFDGNLLVLENLCECGKCFKRDLGRSHRVVVTELQAHRPTPEIAAVDIGEGSIFKIGTPDDVRVGRKLRPVLADDVVEVQSNGCPLGT